MNEYDEPAEPTSDEEVLAFLEGALSPTERDRVAHRIAEDDDAYFVLAEAARFLDEEAPAAGVAEPVPLPAPDRPSIFGLQPARWLAVAAATLLVAPVVFLATLNVPGPAAPDWHAALTRDAAPQALAEHLDDSQANLFGFAAVDAPEARAFRMGRLRLDYEIAFHAGTGHAAVAAEIADRLGEVAGNRERAAVEQALAAHGPARLPALDHALASSAGDSDHYRLGQWVEASRIAAAVGNRRFFASDEFMSGLAHARAQSLPAEVRVEVERIDSALGSEEPDLRVLERAFEQVALLY